VTGFRLDGQVAAVVGGTGVLGGAMADGLAAAGARLAILGRSCERGEARVEAIVAAGGEAAFFVCDAVERDSLEQARDRLDASLGAPSILVNAAGGNRPEATVTAEQPFEAIELDSWRGALDLNLAAGVVLPCQVFGPAMVAAGAGSIINIGSVAAHQPLSRVAAYSAAKAAVLSVTRFLAREWAGAGVRVNAITPGFFPAEQNRRLLYREDGSPTARGQQILARTPMGRFGDPHELVGTVVYLASPEASGFVTGAEIPVDGGFLATSI